MCYRCGTMKAPPPNPEPNPELVTTTIDGITPGGRPFRITTKWRPGSCDVASRHFDWLPAFGVGNVGIPMYRNCWYGELYYYLTRSAEVPEYLLRNCFATYEGGQQFNHPSLK